MNTLIAEPAGYTEPGGSVTIAFVGLGRRVGEPERSVKNDMAQRRDTR